ncbi:MAG: hypothetical protein AAF352_05520, partial [Pseudomonadota bacterium]
VLVIGPTIAQAWDRMFYLERACRTFHLAATSNRELKIIDSETARHAAQQWEEAETSAFDFLKQMHHVLAREEAAYRQA